MTATIGMTKCQIQSTTQSAVSLMEKPCLSYVLFIIHVMLMSVLNRTKVAVMEFLPIVNVLASMILLNTVWYKLAKVGQQMTLTLSGAAMELPFYLYTDSTTVTLVTISAKL